MEIWHGFRFLLIFEISESIQVSFRFASVWYTEKRDNKVVYTLFLYRSKFLLGPGSMFMWLDGHSYQRIYLLVRTHNWNFGQGNKPDIRFPITSYSRISAIRSIIKRKEPLNVLWNNIKLISDSVIFRQTLRSYWVDANWVTDIFVYWFDIEKKKKNTKQFLFFLPIFTLK